MRISLLLLLLIIVGCGKNGGNSPPKIIYSVDPELESYVEEFYQEAEAFNKNVHKNISVSFKSGDLNPDKPGYQVGLCTRYPTGGVVFISKDFFEATIEVRKRALIHHELGHCVLNRNHRTSLMTIPYHIGTDITPAISLMFPTVIPGIDINEVDYIENNFNLWLEELFFPNSNEEIFSSATDFHYDESEGNLFYQSIETFSTTEQGCTHHHHNN